MSEAVAKHVASMLQIVSVELGVGCNLSDEHPQCPNSLGVDRYASMPTASLLTDHDIIQLYTELSHLGFGGWVNFSFYNEPLLQINRLLALIPRIQSVLPSSPLMLITNGVLLPTDLTPLTVFQGIWVTDYGDNWTPSPRRLSELRQLLGEGTWPREEQPRGLFVSPGRLDRRLKGPGKERRERPCVLPFKDLAFDAFGRAHICCVDWRGNVALGDARDGLVPLLTRWEQVVRTIAGTHMTDDAPPTCVRCRFAGFQRLHSFNPAARRRAEAWIALIREQQPERV